MTLHNFHWHPGITGSTGCEIVVPGLGKIHIENCILEDLKKRINEECLAALKIKLGQVIQTEPQHIVGVIP